MSTYKIYPVAEFGEVKLSSHYIRSDGKHVYIDRDGKTVIEGTPPKDVRPFGQMVSRTKPLIVHYTQGLPADEKVLNHWRDQSGMTCNGYVNKNLKAKQFVLEIESEVIYEANKLIQQKLLIANQLNGASTESLRNTAFLMGEFNPKNMEREEIFTKLVGVRFDGPALTKKHKTPNGEVLIFNDFRTRQDEEKEMLLVIMKAINWDILKMESGQFMSGATALGSTPEEVLLTCRANPDMYSNNIRAKVVRADQNVPDAEAQPVPSFDFAEVAEQQAPVKPVATNTEKHLRPAPSSDIWDRRIEKKLPPNVFKGKPELTEEEVTSGWRVKSIGFGKFKKYNVNEKD